MAGLLAAGYEVAALDLFKPAQLFGDVDWIIGSAIDEPLLASAMSDCDIVAFLAASSLPGSANADMSAEISSHVRMVVKAAEIACDQGVSKFLFASSGGTVYGPSLVSPLREDYLTRPINAYGASKVAIELYLRVLRQTRAMQTTSLRIANPYGVGQRAHRNQGFIAAAMSAAINGKTLPCWGDGSVTRDFIYVTDVAEAFVLCCRFNGQAQEINIGSGEGRSLRDVIAAVQQVTNRTLTIDYQRDRNIDVKTNVLDIHLAADTLNWRPKTSFIDGIRLTAEWWAQEYSRSS